MSQPNLAEKQPNGEIQETNKSDKMAVSRDATLNLLVHLNVGDGKLRLVGQFANREDIFRLRCYALMGAGEDEQQKAKKIYETQEAKNDNALTEAQIIAKGKQAEEISTETRDAVVVRVNKLFNFLISLVGNSPLGGEPKSLVKFESTSAFDLKTGHGKAEGTISTTNRRPDLPVGAEFYALSPADMATLKEKVKDVPECKLIDEDSPEKGYFVIKFGNVPVIFAESGRVDRHEAEMSNQHTPETSVADDNAEPDQEKLAA